MRASHYTWRALLDEARRAELDDGGLLIDFGTADQHKYSRGGWNTGWGENRRDTDQRGGATLGVTTASVATLRVVTQQTAAAIVLRARGSQRLTVKVDGAEIGVVELKKELSVVRVSLEKPLPAGSHTIELAAPKKGVELDWVWLARQASAERPVAIAGRTGPIRLARKVRRALLAPGSRAFHFHLNVPAGAALVFDYGASKKARFEVVVNTDGAAETRAFTADGGGAWKEAKVDLSRYAGSAVRLTLRTEGSGAGWGEPEIMIAGKRPAERPAKRARSAIFILIDTARADLFEPFNPSTKAHAPAFSAFARQSTAFVSAYNNENWTKPSVATSLSGVYPSTHDAKRDASRLPDGVELLPQHLRKHGVISAGFVANGFVSKKFGFEKGWNHFRNYIREGKSYSASRVYADAAKWLKKNHDKRFFLYIQTIDPHAPLEVDDKYIRRYYEGDCDGPLGDTIDADDQAELSTEKIPQSDDNLAWIKALYRAEVTYHDEHMGKFLDQVKALGLVDDVVLLVTNDHGEELGDHKHFGHGHSLYEDLIRAPLTVRLPGLFEPGAKIAEIVEHVDVTPTLLDLLGLPPMRHAEGRSLVPLIRNKPDMRPYYAVIEMLDNRRALRVGRWKLMVGKGLGHLFDLETDPGENKDLIKERPIARRTCEIYLGEALATPKKAERQRDATTRRRFKSSKVKISGAVRRKLEALGYFGEH